MIRRYLHRHVSRALSWEDHVTTALDVVADEPYEAPEFADPVLTDVDRLFLRSNGIEAS